MSNQTSIGVNMLIKSHLSSLSFFNSSPIMVRECQLGLKHVIRITNSPWFASRLELFTLFNFNYTHNHRTCCSFLQATYSLAMLMCDNITEHSCSSYLMWSASNHLNTECLWLFLGNYYARFFLLSFLIL